MIGHEATLQVHYWQTVQDTVPSATIKVTFSTIMLHEKVIETGDIILLQVFQAYIDADSLSGSLYTYTGFNGVSEKDKQKT